MKAQFVNENIEFERGQDPKKAMGIGRYFIPPIEELLKDVSWAQPEKGWNPELENYDQWREEAMKPDKSDGYRKYIEFCIIPGHISPSASSVFEDWIKNKGNELTLKEIKDALNDLWPDTDESSKYSLIEYAKNKGIE